MELTVRIEAPALVDAIYALAASLGDNSKPIDYVPTELAAAALAPVAAPMAPPVTPEQAVPTLAPVAAPAPAPEQTVPALAPAPAAVPTAPAPTYTMEQLAVAATQLVDAGRRTELVSLLGQFGVPALTALPKDQYGNFATALRQMGAKI